MLPTVLLFVLLYKGAILLIVKPLFTAILQLMLTITGYQLAFDGNIRGFFLLEYNYSFVPIFDVFCAHYSI